MSPPPTRTATPRPIDDDVDRPPDVPTRRLGAGASLFLRDLLSGPVRSGAVAGTTRRAVYLRTTRDPVDGRGDAWPAIVAVERPGGVRLPNAVTVGARAGDDLATLRTGQEVRIGGRGIAWDTRAGCTTGASPARPTATIRVVVGRWWDPRPHGRSLDRLDVGRAREVVGGRVADDGRAFGLEAAVARLREAVREGVSDRGGSSREVGAACRDLVGRGPGLTPAGDDVLAGLLALLRHVEVGSRVPSTTGGRAGAVADAVRAAVVRPQVLARTNDVSADLLRCADRGGVAGPARAVLGGLGAPTLSSAVHDLAGIGHTSGRDLLVGIRLGLDVVARAWPDAAPSSTSAATPPSPPVSDPRA